MQRTRITAPSVLTIAGFAFVTACFPAIPVGMVTGAIARGAPSPVYHVTLDSLRAGEPIRVWMAHGERAEFVPARFDSIRVAVLYFARNRDAMADSATLARVARLDVTRGTRKDPTRAFWMPVLWGTVGYFVGTLAACADTDDSLCGLAGITFGGLPGMIFGTWWGLRSVPRWVTVALP